jgi:hypothetical protein
MAIAPVAAVRSSFYLVAGVLVVAPPLLCSVFCRGRIIFTRMQVLPDFVLAYVQFNFWPQEWDVARAEEVRCCGRCPPPLPSPPNFCGD